MAKDIEVDESSFASVVDKAIRDIADEVFTKSQENLVQMEAVDTAMLLKSGNVKKITDGHYRIGYFAPYAEFVEFGSEPHMPPIEPLVGWVKRNLKVSSDSEARSVAFAVAQSIAKHGIQPRPYLRNALEAVRR